MAKKKVQVSRKIGQKAVSPPPNCVVKTMKSLNRDYRKRNQIIFEDSKEDFWFGGIKHFENLNLTQLKELVDNNFIKLNDAQNNSPTVEEFLNFMVKYPGVLAHGYAVTHKRSDYRVSIEGLTYKGEVRKKLLKEFVNLCRQADDFKVEDKFLYSWWD